MGLLADLGEAVGELLAGAYRGVKRATARKYPTLEEIYAADAKRKAEQARRLRELSELPDEKTPAERPSRMPPPPEFPP